MITAAQCRSARAFARLVFGQAHRCRLVTETSIDDFELERHAPDGPTVNAIEHAFGAVGVAFSSDG
jgi:hypothetical protein